MLIELFSLGRTAEALRAIIGDFAPTRVGWHQVEGVAPHQTFFFSEK